MNRDEFRQWGLDFIARFPHLSDWLFSPELAATRTIWFDELFSKHSLAHALAATKEFHQAGEFKESWAKDGLFRLYLKRLSELEYAARKADAEVERKLQNYLFSCDECQDTGFVVVNRDPLQYARCGHCEKLADHQPYKSGRVLPLRKVRS